jgi:hypothetical protein
LYGARGLSSLLRSILQASKNFGITKIGGGARHESGVFIIVIFYFFFWDHVIFLQLGLPAVLTPLEGRG